MRPFLLSTLLLLATGCVGPRQLAPPSPAEQTPAVINAALSDQHVTVELWGGEVYHHVETARIAGDSLFFTSNRVRPAERSVPLAEVHRVS